MKKVILAMLFSSILLTMATAASAATLTVVSGTITYANSSIVDNAQVTVTCEHMGANTTKVVMSGVDGKYYAFYPALNCDTSDTVWVMADKDGAQGMNSGLVSYNKQCKINTALIDVQIPEFGVMAGGIALVGALAGLTVIRKRK